MSLNRSYSARWVITFPNEGGERKQKRKKSFIFHDVLTHIKFSFTPLSSPCVCLSPLLSHRWRWLSKVWKFLESWRFRCIGEEKFEEYFQQKWKTTCEAEVCKEIWMKSLKLCRFLILTAKPADLKFPNLKCYFGRGKIIQFF